MAAHWRRGLAGLAALIGVGLQACVVTPARRVVYGYGGSGYSSYVDPRVARDACLYQARDVRRYRGVRAGSVAITGPETAHVRLHSYGLFTRYDFDCTYDARTGSAYVP